MVYILITQDGKSRKFLTDSKLEIYLKRHEGVFYVFQPGIKFAGISVIVSKDGEIEKLADQTIHVPK